MQKTTDKISYLDGIRGVAAFLVFFHHFLLAFYTAYYTGDVKQAHLRNGLEISYGRSVFSFLSNGNFCVCIFFVLSGYVLSRKYFQVNTTSILISGAQRRFIRLYIPVAFTLVLSYILANAGLYFNGQANVIAHSGWWFGPFLNSATYKLLFLQDLAYGTMFNGSNAFDTSMWTMSIELYGSFFVFAFLALTHNTKNRGTMLLFALLYCFFTDSVNSSAFVLGICMNYIVRSRGRLNKPATTLFAAMLLVAALLLGSFPGNNIAAGTFFAGTPAGILAYSAWFHTVGGFLLVLAFVLSSGLQRFISMRLFRFLGYISFSFYLLHPLVLSSFSSFVFLRLCSRLGYNRSTVVVFILTTIVCLFASWLMTKYIDTPGVNFAKYVYNRFVKKAPEPQKEGDNMEAPASSLN